MRKWLALLLALVLLLNGTLAVYAEEQGNPTDLDDEYLEQDPAEDDVSQEDPADDETGGPEDLAGGEADGDGEAQQDLDSREPAVAEDQESGQAEMPDEESPEDIEAPAAFASAKGKYVFVVTDPGESNYRRWEDPLLLLGEAFQYDLYLSWYENGEYEIVSTLEEGMGVAFAYEESPCYNLYWDESGYHIEFTATQTGIFNLDMEYIRPDNGKRAEYWLTVGVAGHHYAFVVSDPGSDNYREWDHPTVRAGESARYALHLARIEDGAYHVIDPDGNAYIDIMNWEIEEQRSEDFSVAWEEDGYYLRINPNGQDYYEIELSYRYPDIQWTEYPLLQLHVEGKEAKYEYELVIVDSDSGALRPWDEPSVKLGESVRHAVTVARVVGDGYEPIDISPDKLQLGLIEASIHISLFWEDGNYYVDAHPSVTGVFWRDAAYNHPDTGERVEIRLHYTCWQTEYAVVVSEPGSGDYHPWDHPVVPVGTEARYQLNFAKVMDGQYEILPWNLSSSQLGVTRAHFSMEWEDYNDRYLEVHPQQAGAYNILMSFVHPETRKLMDASLWLMATDEDPSDYLFLVGGPDHSLLTWREGETGAAALHYLSQYGPEHTFRLVCREEWTLHDPEGILRLVSETQDAAVFATERLSWEEPFEFRSGGTVMSLYALLPPTTTTVPVLYDEALKDAPEKMTYLPRASLEAGQEVKVAIRYFEGGWDWLATNPLDLVRIDGQAEVYAEPGAKYFTLIPQEPGELGILVQRGRLTKVNIGYEEPVKFGYLQENHYLSDKSNLVSSVRGRLLYRNELLELGHALVSSNPEVISVEADEENPSQFVLRPVGFGEAVISLDSGPYHGQLTLYVTETDVPLMIEYFNQNDPGGHTEVGRPVLPKQEFQGTKENPFLIPHTSRIRIDWPTRGPYLSMDSYISDRFTSSNPDIVRVVPSNGYHPFLEPVNPGVCTITYREGPIAKEVVVRSEPGVLGQVGALSSGFHTYYGSGEVRVESVSLEGGLPVPMGVVVEPWKDFFTLEQLDPASFRFSDPGIARVEIAGRDRMDLNMFNLIPLREGSTTLTYTTIRGEEFTLAVSVGLPDSAWAFVVRDEAGEFGYRLWESQQVLVGEFLEEEVCFAQVILTEDGRIHSLELREIPADMAVETQDEHTFSLSPHGAGWRFRAVPQLPGEYHLTITATPPGISSPQTWEAVLYSTEAVEVSERSVAAINRAIRTAPVADGYETVILLPSGYIPMDYNTPVILDRPVTLRGRDTVLASEVVAMCQTPGAKLQNLTIRFDGASFCDYKTRFTYLYLFSGVGGSGSVMGNTPYSAVYGNGIITLENCVVDGGTGQAPPTIGVGVQGSRVTFRGANTIRGIATAGFVVESTPGPRLYMRGLTFENNKYAVVVSENGSIDPYFIRLTESNFINNRENVVSSFPVNFSHNYFEGGDDDGHIMKSPQYSQRLAGDSPDYPSLLIEEDRLNSAELLNFEGQAPIDATNFTVGGGPVQIAVRELDGSGVSEEDTSTVLLRWTFAPSASPQDSPLFRPDASIDEQFQLPADSGIETYQGVSFAHHGPLPLEGAEISVLKKTLFEEETLYLYRLTGGTLTPLGEIDNTEGEFYRFHLDGCSDYIITNVVVETAGGGDGNGSGNGGGNGSGNQGGNNGNGDGSGGGDEGNGGDGNGDTGEGSIPGDGGNNSGDNNIGGDNSKKGAEDRRDHFSANIPDNAAVPHDAANETFSGGTQNLPSGNEEEAFRSSVPPVVKIPSNHTEPVPYAYAHIPAPQSGTATPQSISANRYVDDTAIRTAFDNPHNGQVVIDVSVRTAVSPLAFQLLAETPELALVLKGDGYEWRFAGGDIRDEESQKAFDTSVTWNAAQGEGYARISFQQQGELPGNCLLILEAAGHPRQWAAYRTSQSQYMPCTLDARRQGTRLQMKLDTLGEYVALL